MDQNLTDISDVRSEAGIVGTAILNPEITFYSEQLTPHMFVNEQNAYLYFALCELAKQGVSKADAYNITNILNSRAATKEKADNLLPVSAIQDFIANAQLIARSDTADYMLLVNNVLGCAFRRETLQKLRECENICRTSSDKDITQKIYSTLDKVVMDYSAIGDVTPYKDIIDEMWKQIQARQIGGNAGIPWKFPTLNRYCTIESGELAIVCSIAKGGKSMFLLNEAVDLMKRGLSVLYVDSELGDRMFTTRLLSHLTGIDYYRLKNGTYSQEENSLILDRIAWCKQQRFSPVYMPMFNINEVYSMCRKTKHTTGLDVVVVDYFKSDGKGEASDISNNLGTAVDTIKNVVCGSMDVAGLGAAQAKENHGIADSVKIGRNASTIMMLDAKTPQEIEADGAECGNKKLFIKFNRNGEQMFEGEYIDLAFNGNKILLEEAKQHAEITPY